MARLARAGWFRPLLPIGILCLSLIVPTMAMGGTPVATKSLIWPGFTGCTATIHAEWANQPRGSIRLYDVALQNNVNGTVYGVLDVRMKRSGVVDLVLPLAADPGNSKNFTAYLRFFDRDHLVFDFLSAGPYAAECQ
jgi:hypothetical protein